MLSNCFAEILRLRVNDLGPVHILHRRLLERIRLGRHFASFLTYVQYSELALAIRASQTGSFQWLLRTVVTALELSDFLRRLCTLKFNLFDVDLLDFQMSQALSLQL